MIMEAFPAHHRATGMSMVDSFGVTIFGVLPVFCDVVDRCYPEPQWRLPGICWARYWSACSHW